MKRLIDNIARYVLTVSGFTTSVVILLIIGFLFKEAVGLFNNPIVEDGYVLALNKENDVKRLSAQQIKNIFDEEITNWKEVGGKDMPITVFRLEDLDKHYTEAELGAEYEYAGDKIAEQVHQTPGIVAYVPDVLMKGQKDIHYIENQDIPVKDVLLGNEWFPTATPSPIFGILPLISGTLWVSFFRHPHRLAFRACHFHLSCRSGKRKDPKIPEANYRITEWYSFCRLRFLLAWRSSYLSSSRHSTCL